MKNFSILLSIFLLLILATHAGSATEEKIGLVLAGGGARGIAHVGVITALEELRVPVHAVAGTSMGALVGGLYAIGMESSQLQQVIREMDWEKAFEDRISRRGLSPRRKSDDYDLPFSVPLSIKEGQASIPLGIVQGQQVRQIIKELVLEAEHINDFDELPIPYRAVATDIETGDAYIFQSGNIVSAMRASMSLPGILAPLVHEGHLLVDGGMAMNIPVSVGRDMGSTRLIVVDIGTPLRKRDEITNVLGVADQMLNFLTRKNSLEELAKLGEGDILINPDLAGIDMLDFEMAEAIFKRGYDAAMALRDKLQPLALSESAWSQYRAARTLPPLGNRPVDAIVINNNSPISDDVIRARLRQQTGQPLDRAQLQEDIQRIYALDYWEIIDYDITFNQESENQLTVNALSKSWGRDRLKAGLNLLTDLDGSSDINIGGSYLLKGVTDLGGELYGRAQVGDTPIFDAEFYQPLDVYSRFFLVPHARYKDTRVFNLGPEFETEDSVGTWRTRRLQLDLELGWNLFRNSQLRVGAYRSKGEYKSDLEIGLELSEDRFDEGGVTASYRYDNLDNVYFPTSGGFLYGEYRANRKTLGGDENFERWYAITQAAFSFGADNRNTVIVTGKTGQSAGASNEPQNYYQLGGLFNLSGLRQDLFSGRQMAFAMAQYQRRLSDNSVLPIDMPVYLGASIEGGQVWSHRSEISSDDFVNGGSLYLAMDSPIGPIYLAYGRSEDSLDALYLSLGWPFLSDQMRLGR